MCVLGGGGTGPLKRAEFSPFATGRDARAIPGIVYHDELHRMPTLGRLDNLVGGGVLDFWQLGFGWLLDSSSSGEVEPRGFGWLLLSCSVVGVYL